MLNTGASAYILLILPFPFVCPCIWLISISVFSPFCFLCEFYFSSKIPSDKHVNSQYKFKTLLSLTVNTIGISNEEISKKGQAARLMYMSLKVIILSIAVTSCDVYRCGHGDVNGSVSILCAEIKRKYEHKHIHTHVHCVRHVCSLETSPWA